MSKHEEHIKQHYVPQTYLRQFAHSNGKQKNPIYFLNVCNRQAPKPFCKNVDEVCQLPYFYQISDEYLSDNTEENLNKLSLEVDYFADYVETNLASILAEICRRKENCIQHELRSFPMVENDKYLISEQIVIQFLRHPQIREYCISFFDDYSHKMLRLFQQGLAKELHNPGIAKLNIGIKKDDTVVHAKDTFLNDDIVSTFAKDLSKNLWAFAYSPEKIFMTSDNPIVCIQQFPDERPFNMGLNQKGAIKFFALAPDLLLIIMDETITSGIDCKFSLASEDCIKTYHKALRNQSNEIYSYQKFDDNFKL